MVVYKVLCDVALLRLLFQTQNNFDFIYVLVQWLSRIRVNYDLSIFVYYKFWKVPGDVFDLSCLLIVKAIRVLPKFLKNYVSFISINFYLVHQWKRCPHCFLSIIFNLLVVCRFLLQKLIARKSNDLQTTRLVFIVNVDKFNILPMRVRSFGSYINNYCQFKTACEVSNFLFLTIDRRYRQV